MVGDGPLRKEAEELCEELDICDHVQFLGKLKSAKEVLSISDLFILPSENESFGLAALEAMASGVPVIATNAGGVPEVVEHGVSGFLSNVGDVSDMANNAMKILSDDKTLKKFREASLESSRRFELEKIIPHYIKLYEEVISL